jgi:hypothetical protein
VTTVALVDLLARHPRFQAPALIKVDTDGHDAAILRAARPVLVEHRPVLFFEHDPMMAATVGAPNAETIFVDLAALGYDTFAVYGNLGDPVAVYRSDDLDAVIRRSADQVPGSDRGDAYFDIVAIHRTDDAITSAVAEAF